MSDILPGGSDAKESVCNAGDPASIPGSGRYPREGNGNPLQYSCLENPVDWSLEGYSSGVAMGCSDMTEQLSRTWTIARQAPLSTVFQVCSNSCSLSWSCYLTKSTSIIFPAAFLTFWLCVTFWQFSQCFKYFHYYIYHSDLWLVILDVTISKRWQLAKSSDWWWLAFFSNKLCLINIKKANILAKWSKTITI